MVPSWTGAYLWSLASNVISSYLRPWQVVWSMGSQVIRGDVKLQVEESDAMEGDISFQKLQLPLPDEFEE